VRCIENNASILVTQIIKDHQVESKLDNQTMPMNFFSNSNERTHKNLEKENGNFIWFQLFIETLLRMRTIDVTNSLEEFVNLCNEQYIGNDRQLNKIKDFRQNYDPDHCLWWYSKEVFIYGILNKALRIGDMDTLYTLRFFIRDLYRELNENKYITTEQSTILDLYRGQVLSYKELENIQSSIGQYISMNSFFSTTIRRPMALMMAQSSIDCSEYLKPVIFHIKADTRLLNVKPYSDITQFSNFGEEEGEVLFMLGSVFRFRRVYFQEDENIHVIDLELCGEDENELREVYSRMKKDIGQETNIKILGNVLKDMGQYERALQCYEKVLKLVETNEETITRCYYSIGQVLQLQGQYEKSLLNFDKVLEFETTNPSEDSIIVGLTHNYIGIAYQYGALRHDYIAALAHYERALKIHLDVKGRIYAGTAYVYNNLATLHRVLGDYDKSLEYHHICLDIKKELYPDYFNPTIASSLNNIGVVYHEKKDYPKALDYYNKALEIRLKALPENHQDQAGSYTNIGQIYELLGEYQLALDHTQKALAIYQTIFDNNYHYVLMVKDQIEILKQKLNEQ
jgi:tetratricopeptide (TPR) repeat protein